MLARGGSRPQAFFSVFFLGHYSSCRKGWIRLSLPSLCNNVKFSSSANLVAHGVLAMRREARRDAVRYLMDGMDGMDDMDRATARVAPTAPAKTPEGVERTRACASGKGGASHLDIGHSVLDIGYSPEGVERTRSCASGKGNASHLDIGHSLLDIGYSPEGAERTRPDASGEGSAFARN